MVRFQEDQIFEITSPEPKTYNFHNLDIRKNKTDPQINRKQQIKNI